MLSEIAKGPGVLLYGVSSAFRAIASMVFNGTFAVMAKIKRVTEAKVDPSFLLFISKQFSSIFTSVLEFLSARSCFGSPKPFRGNLSIGLGTFLCFNIIGGDCLLGYFLVSDRFEDLVLAVLFSFLAISFVGLSIGQGVWGGAGIVVSWFAGGFLDGFPTRLWENIVALILLLIGVIVIAFNDFFAFKIFGNSDSASDTTNYQELIEEEEPANAELREDEQSFTKGVICSLIVGLCGGSVLVPMKLADPKDQGLYFIVSMGIGVIISGFICTALYIVFKPNSEHTDNPIHRPWYSEFEFEATFVPGLISGILWNIGNVASIFATQSALGFAVAQPFFQCALFVSGIWGIFIFHEIKHSSNIIVFFSGGVILLIGAVLLAVAGGTD